MLISPLFVFLLLLCLIVWGAILNKREDKEICLIDFIFLGFTCIIFFVGYYFKVIEESNDWLRHKCAEKDKIIAEKTKEIRELRGKYREIKHLITHPRECGKPE